MIKSEIMEEREAVCGNPTIATIPMESTNDGSVSPMDISKNDWDLIFNNMSDINAASPKQFNSTDNQLSISQASESNIADTKNVPNIFYSEDIDTNNLLTDDNNNAKDVAMDRAFDDAAFNNKFSECANEAIELALANEIELHSPWVDVSALAASITNPSVNVREQEPLSIFPGATFVPTHIQSYIDLHGNTAENIMDTMPSDVYSYLPDVRVTEEDKHSFTEEVIDTMGTNTLVFDANDDPEINDVFNSRSTEHTEINKLFEKDSRISEAVNVFGMENLEINAANSVLFNTDLNLEDTLLFDNEPPSDMYVVQTENIFKVVTKRNILQDLTAEADICKCVECKCDPLNMQCQSGCGSSSSDEESETEKTSEKSDKCNCVDCKCDPSTMQCQAGCGGRLENDSSNYLEYHKRHASAKLEDYGLFAESVTMTDTPTQIGGCCSKKQISPTPVGGCCSRKQDTPIQIGGCCSTIQDPEPLPKTGCCGTGKTAQVSIATEPVILTAPPSNNSCCCSQKSSEEPSKITNKGNSLDCHKANETSGAVDPLIELISSIGKGNKNPCSCSSTTEGLKNGCCIVVCLKTIESLRQLITYGYNLNNLLNAQTQKCSDDSLKFVSKHVGCNNITTI